MLSSSTDGLHSPCSPNTVYSERRCEPTMAQKSWPVVTPQQALPPRRCREGASTQHSRGWRFILQGRRLSKQLPVPMCPHRTRDKHSRGCVAP